MSPEDANKWAPWCFRIHSLDCSTKTSAVAHAQRIVDSIAPFRIPPPPFSTSKEYVPVPLHRIVVNPSNASAGHNLSSAEITSDTTGFHDGTIDPRCLEGVMKYITKQGFECEITPAAGNDRSIFLNYEITATKALTATETSQALAHIFAQLDCKLHKAWGFKFNEDSRTARGNCSDTSPSNCAKLVAQSPYEGGARATFSKLVITPVRYIQPSYFTTLALYTAKCSIAGVEPYTRFFHSLAYEYNKSTGATSFISKIRRSDTGGYILLDPSTADLATFLCARPGLTGYFPVRVYDLNASSMNFRSANIEKANRETMLAYEATKRHEALRTRVEAPEDRFSRSGHRTDTKFTQLAVGVKRGSATTIRREESAGLEVLQAEKRSIEREILKLGPTRSSAQNALRLTLQEDLRAVDEAITSKNEIRAEPNRAFIENNLIPAAYRLAPAVEDRRPLSRVPNKMRAESNRALVESNLVPAAYRLAPRTEDRRPLSRLVPTAQTSKTSIRSLTLEKRLDEQETKRQKSELNSTIQVCGDVINAYTKE